MAKNTKFKNNVDQQTCLTISLKIEDLRLRDLIQSKAVGYHHGGMSQNDRNQVEELYLGRHLLVLFCTTTLSLGVNMPTKLVIIKSTKSYQNGKFVNYTAMDLIQMIGRAGRPKFHKTAKSIIICQQGEEVSFHFKLKWMFQKYLN